VPQAPPGHLQAPVQHISNDACRSPVAYKELSKSLITFQAYSHVLLLVEFAAPPAVELLLQLLCADAWSAVAWVRRNKLRRILDAPNLC